MAKPKTSVEPVDPRGNIRCLTKYINRMSVMLHKSETIGNIKNIEKKIEFTMFRINKLIESIWFCLLTTKMKEKMPNNFVQSIRKEIVKFWKSAICVFRMIFLILPPLKRPSHS